MTQFHLTCRLNLKNTQVLRTICAPPANRAASNTIQNLTRVLNLWKIWTRKMLNKELWNFGTLSPPAPQSTNGSFCQIFYPHAEQEWWWCLPSVLVFKPLPRMIDTGLLVVLTITFTMLLSVLILLSYDFEEWCPQVLTTTVTHLYSSELTQVYSALFNSTVSIFKKNPLRKKTEFFNHVFPLQRDCSIKLWHRCQYIGKHGNSFKKPNVIFFINWMVMLREWGTMMIFHFQSSHCDKSAGGYNKDPIKWDWPSLLLMAAQIWPTLYENRHRKQKLGVWQVHKQIWKIAARPSKNPTWLAWHRFQSTSIF